jgi:hypothetical protein
MSNDSQSMAIDFGGEARHLYESASKQVQTDAAPILEFLSRGFTITWFREHRPRVWVALVKPHDHVADYFTLPKEYVLIGHGFPNDFQQRTLLAEPPQDVAYRVDDRVRFVASAAPMMRAACAAWATQRRIAVVPLDPARDFTPDSGTAQLYELLATSLWRRDVFDDPEPVANAAEFFGRELIVQQIVTKTYLGQLSAIFGLRKIGKTSLIRRVRDLLDSDRSSLSATALVQCNATRVKAGRWFVVLLDLLEGWASAINHRAAEVGSKSQARAAKLPALFGSGKPMPTDALIADAFQKDVEKLLKAARTVATHAEASHVRLVALFDEADELYPQRTDAGYWREDYFALWNSLQTLKRGGDDPSEVVYILGGVNPAGVEAGALVGRPNPLFELSRLFLKPLTEKESRELLTGLGARVGLAFDEEAMASAFAITGGHPWLLRKLGSQIHQIEGSGSSKVVVTRPMVERVFARTRRSFYQHVEWILSHLRDVAPDEYRLLHDIAVGGKDRYLSEWRDVTFRETFAEHLAQYGILRFDEDVPAITIGLVRDALAQPSTEGFREQKAQIREAGDTLESMIRARLVADVRRERTPEEAVDFVVSTVPRDAKNRPKDREQLRALGNSAGMQALVESLNWGDYLLVLGNPDACIVWSGPQMEHEDRIQLIRRTVESIHLARHNNDAELRSAIDKHGFEVLWRDIARVREMLSQ